MSAMQDNIAAAVRRLAGSYGNIARHTEANWGSSTFVGTRHVIDLEFAGEGAIDIGEDFIAYLPDHEFLIRGQLVAEAAVTKVERKTSPLRLTVTCELLCVEDRQ